MDHKFIRFCEIIQAYPGVHPKKVKVSTITCIHKQWDHHKSQTNRIYKNPNKEEEERKKEKCLKD
jgi:hypothetical protein